MAFAWFKDPTILTEFKPLASKIPGVFMSRWLLVKVLAIISFGFVSTAHARDLEVAGRVRDCRAQGRGLLVEELDDDLHGRGTAERSQKC